LAIAMGEGEEEGVVREVIDGVLSMCLVSSSDQDRYILAAGAALGRAGKWRGLIDYVKNGEHSTQFGQPLVAAAMIACIQNQKYSIALTELYQQFADNQPAPSEYQWAGGYGSVHPLCRDLALRAMGSMEGGNEEDDVDGQPRLGSSVDSVFVLNQILEERGTVSIDGLQGVLSTCERDGNFEKAVNVLYLLLNYDEDSLDWKLVPGCAPAMEYFLDASNSSVSEIVTENDGDALVEEGGGRVYVNGNILASVMDACNNAGEFGLAVYYCRVVNTTSGTINDRSLGLHDEDKGQNIVRSLLLAQPLLSSNEKLLTATMFSLCGLGCTREAVALHSEVFEMLGDEIEWPLCAECVLYAKSLDETSDPSWLRAYTHIDRVLAALLTIRSTKSIPPAETVELLQRGVAQMIQSCADADQSITGLHLAQMAAHIAQHQEPKKSMKETVQSFFMRDSSTSDRGSLVRGDSEVVAEFLTSSDAILSPAMEVTRNTAGIDDALALFYSRCEKDDSVLNSIQQEKSAPQNRQWINSVNGVLAMLLEKGKLDDAFALFEGVSLSSRTPETYLIMARGLATDKRWDDVSLLFVTALDTGCLSEDLGLITMEGVVQQNVKGKIRILRSIASDVATMLGMKPGVWIVSHYWLLKNILGFHHARLLMWWNDPNETQARELELALRHFEANRSRGILVKDDVLRCIVKLLGVRHKERSIVSKTGTTNRQSISHQKKIESYRTKSVNLTLEAFSEASRTSLGEERSFTFEVASGLRKMGANRECMDFVHSLIKRNVALNRTTLLEGQAAAKSEGDAVMLKYFTDLGPSSVNLKERNVD